VLARLGAFGVASCMALHAKLDLLREQDWARVIALVERQQAAIDRLDQRLAASGTADDLG
jgi:hypothetical protein